MKLLKVPIVLFFLLFGSTLLAQNNALPVISVTARQAYCPLDQINIAPNFTISDADDSGIAAFFIQISSGYIPNVDRLILNGNHPSINVSWNSIEGKMSLTPSSGSEILYTDLELAVRDIVYESSDANVLGEKFFSFNIGDANFLPSTNHFYEYVSDVGIDWESARQAAANRTYFGLQGYLATIGSSEEAQITGEQAAGAGWIGGSDADEEGTWRWMTGPEAGTIFWIGGIAGASPNFAFWNSGEPNNLNNEDYAHVTDPTIGNPGSWNDLQLNGDSNGAFQPKGYMVEYGGMPGDPTVNISASTSVYVPEIINTTEADICLMGSAVLNATPSEGDVLWYDAITGGNLLATGNSFTTPVLNQSTVYYATVSVNGCINIQRTPVTVNVNQSGEVTDVIDDLVCYGGSGIISANVSAGEIVWFDSPTSTNPITTGGTLITPPLFSTTIYYVEAFVNACGSSVREPVTVTVDPLVPTFDLPQEATICLGSEGVMVDITNPNGTFTYQWRDELSNLVGEGTSVELPAAGIYTVLATSIGGCVSTPRTIVVEESERVNFTSDNLEIDDVSENNSIKIKLENLGTGPFEFAIDAINGVYQTETTFQNIPPGLHTLYIRNTQGCGALSYQFSVLDYPNFFTPNNDGLNDVWQLTGINRSFYTVSNISVFNRFGVLVARIDASNNGWDGSYQGRKLPSSDYWFTVKLTDINGKTIERHGHFSLLRR
ncbi:MAG: T9SS type B sorting domain-containing protein [Flavobacteriaceae bacterium]